MKKNIFTTALSVFFVLSLNASQETEHFYYFQGERIFLQQRADKVFVRFAPNINREHLHNLTNENSTLSQSVSNVKLHDGFAIFEINGRQVSLAFLNLFKEKPEVISATPLFQHNHTILGITDEFIVKLKPTTSYEQLQAFARKNNSIVGEENRFVRNQFIVRVSRTSELNALQKANLFYETGLFVFSEPNFVIFNDNVFSDASDYSLEKKSENESTAQHDVLSTNLGDPYFNRQWGLRNTGQSRGTSGIDINVLPAWQITQGNNIRIAIINDGVDLTHPDLEANLLPGFDAMGDNLGGGHVQSYERFGTFFAGVIAATRNNGIGISGVAPQSKIIPIRGFPRYVTAPFIYSFSEAANAIEWAWRYGMADVICLWSNVNSISSSVIVNAVDSAITRGRNGRGSVIIAPTGNNALSLNTAPTWVQRNVISVGAIDRNGRRGVRSNIGPHLNVVAPGVNVYTTFRHGHFRQVYYQQTYVAAAHVAGVAALILSVRPDLTAQQVRQAIETTARRTSPTNILSRPIYTYSYYANRPHGSWNREMGHGLVNAYSAVRFFHPRIDGPSAVPVINNQAHNVTFFLANVPEGATVTWTTSNNLVRVTALQHSITVRVATPFPQGCETGWIRAVVYTPHAGSLAETRSVYVGRPPNLDFISSQSNHTTVGNTEFIDIITYRGLAVRASNPHGITTAEWQQIPGGGVTITRFFGDHPVDGNSFVYGARAGLTASLPGANTIRARLQNQCGTSNWANISYTRPSPGGPIFGSCPCNCTCCYVSPCHQCGGFDNCPFCPCFSSGGFLAFPNPVDNILTINLTQVETPEIWTGTSTSSATIRASEVFYIRLFNAHGMIVRQQRTSAATIQFDVSNLPEGTYYLHIEHNGEIEKHQIIVQRN